MLAGRPEGVVESIVMSRHVGMYSVYTPYVYSVGAVGRTRIPVPGLVRAPSTDGILLQRTIEPKDVIRGVSRAAESGWAAQSTPCRTCTPDTSYSVPPRENDAAQDGRSSADNGARAGQFLCIPGRDREK